MEAPGNVTWAAWAGQPRCCRGWACAFSAKTGKLQATTRDVGNSVNAANRGNLAARRVIAQIQP
jgi:hypothetical protein